MRHHLAALDATHPERAIARRIKIKVTPAQVDRLAHPQPVPKHHRQEQLVAPLLSAHTPCGIDHTARLVRRSAALAVQRLNAAGGGPGGTPEAPSSRAPLCTAA